MWHRKEERKELWHHFEKGRNIAMFAPRRLGKSWLMKNLLIEDAKTNNWNAVYIDLQNANTCKQAVLAIIGKIQGNGKLGDNLLNRVKAKAQDIFTGNTNSFEDLLSQTNWETMLDVVLGTLAQKADEMPTLIMLDEVTVCATHIFDKSEEDGRQFLNTLRKVRDSYTKIRWMMTGSIGIDHLAECYQVHGAFNNLELFLIEPFSPEIAEAFVTDFCQTGTAKQFSLDPKTHVHLQKRLGWLSPFYLEKLCLRVEPEQVDGHYIATPNSIDIACDKLLTHPYHQVFSGWPDHLERNIPDQLRPVCKVILAYLCQQKDAESLDNIRTELAPEFEAKPIRDALRVLVTDGFLVKSKQPEKYQFAMQLLADYWLEYQA